MTQTQLPGSIVFLAPHRKLLPRSFSHHLWKQNIKFESWSTKKKLKIPQVAFMVLGMALSLLFCVAGIGVFYLRFIEVSMFFCIAFHKPNIQNAMKIYENKQHPALQRKGQNCFFHDCPEFFLSHKKYCEVGTFSLVSFKFIKWADFRILTPFLNWFCNFLSIFLLLLIGHSFKIKSLELKIQDDFWQFLSIFNTKKKTLSSLYFPHIPDCLQRAPMKLRMPTIATSTWARLSFVISDVP